LEKREVPMATKILLVEDDKNLNMMLKLILKNKKLDWELETAHSGDEALKLLQTFRPDAAVLDIMMPGMDGIELAKQIRKDPRNSRCKMAALSALSDPETKKKALAAGINEYWTKPIVPDALVTNLQKLLA
jgi:CheY-like chemotaxis protein